MSVDTQALMDEWEFRRGDMFDPEVVGTRVKQGAAARIARNMDLPEVVCKGEHPM